MIQPIYIDSFLGKNFKNADLIHAKNQASESNQLILFDFITTWKYKWFYKK